MDTITKCILAGVAAAGIYGLWASRADAQEQMPCAPTAELIAKLQKDYHEVEVGGGIVSQEHVFVVYASPDGETWTVLAVGTNGTACVVGAGRYWFPGALPEAPVEGSGPA